MSSQTLFKFAALAFVGSLVLSAGYSPISCAGLGSESELEGGHEVGPQLNSPSSVGLANPLAPPAAPAVPAVPAADPFALLKGFTDMSALVSSFTGPKVIPGLPAIGGDKSKAPAKETGLLGVKDPMDFLKFFLNPLELVNAIAKAFNLDGPKFEKTVARGLDMSMEAALQPPIACIKIIEKVFVPDACMLKFVCEMGKQLAMFKGQMPKFPDSYFEGASTAKALYDGASGRECHHVYDCKEGQGPVLKTEFLGLKNKMLYGEQESNDGYEKSN